MFLRHRFGVAIPQIPLHRCTCKPKPELDRLGTHLVCVCPKGRERLVTHDSMALCIRDMATDDDTYHIQFLSDRGTSGAANRCSEEWSGSDSISIELSINGEEWSSVTSCPSVYAAPADFVSGDAKQRSTI